MEATGMEQELEIVVPGVVIRMIRDEWMMSQARFAKAIGVSREWVVLTEKSDTRRIRPKTLEGLARAMGVSPRDAWGVLDKLNSLGFRRKEQLGYKVPGPVREVANGEERIERVKMRRVPFFDFKIPASGWAESCEPRGPDEADGWTTADEMVPGDAFALRIHGDCMEPEYPNGSIIIFVPIRPGEEKARQFESGRDYYFEHSDGKCTFKRVFYEPQKERFRLESLNKKYKPLFVPEQMLARMSRAIKLVRDLV